MRCRTALFVLFSALALHAAQIKGKITSVVGGEALGRIQLSVLETGATTTSADDGSFVLDQLPPGKYTLRLAAVGYRLLTIPISITTDQDIKDFEIVMAPDNFRRTDTVEVRGDVFQGADP